MAVGFVWAERVSEEDAALVANHFMNVTPSSAHGQKAPAKRMVLKKAAAAEENQFYIYENADGEGWVMVAANDVVRPILAYSETGHFRTDNMPRNVKGWLGKYNRQIKQAEENGIEATAEVTQEWKQLRKGVSIKKATPVVAPLIQTKWDQDDPYWNLCPMKGSTHDCYTGCVATAMAQVMYYWKWPKQGTGSYSYTTQTLRLSCSADFANTTYDWDNMLLKYNGYYPEGSSNWTTDGVEAPTTVQKNAIATLMYHCGVAVAMDYNIASAGGSGAYTIRPNASQTTAKCAQNALVQNFGYKSTIKGYYRSGGYGYSAVSDANWHNYLKTELDAARPIMYAGADDEGGHSFICDGYDNTTPTRKYHFNWGWSGYCDGYYDIDNLAPGIGGAGSGNGSYNDAQDIIIGIEPPVTGHTVVTNGTGCTITPSANFAENDKAFTATITPTDATYDFTSISVKLGTTTLTETTHYTLSNDKQTLTIKASAITGDNSNDLTITAVWTKNRYKYELLGENCDPEMDEGTVAMNGVALNLTILPVSGYTLNNADCWDVTMGENTLTFGTGFTYNASNGAFTIAEVTGDVAIVAYGGNAITWSANGTEFASTVALSNMIQLPTSEPEVECNGKVFVGWCATADYSSESTAPTFVQNGDAISEAKTFYAVFATPGTGGTSSIEKATSIAVGDEVILACESKTMELSSFTTSGTIYGVGSSYSGTPSGDYSFTVVAGSEANSYAFVRDGKYWNWTSGNSLSTATTLSPNTSWAVSFSGGNANITNKSDADRKIQWNAGSPRFACYTSGQTAVQLYKKVGGGTSYSDYTTICTAPCVGDLTSITLNTDNVTKVFTEGDEFTYEGLVVTANYDGCDSKTVTPTSVSTPDMNQIGAQDVTVTYEDKSATYQITVNALPTYAIRFFDNTTLLSSQNVKQGQAATPPTSDPTACEEYTFVGWYTTTLAEDNTVAPSYVTNFTATKDQDYYAVFSRTDGEGGGSRNSTFDTKDQGYSNGDDGGTKEIDDVTFAFAKGTNTSNSPKYYSSSECIHLYPNNTLTISAESNISSIEFTFSRNDGWTAYPGTWNTTTSSWTGEATSITFTVASTTGSQVRISKIVVTIGSGASSTTYYTTAPTCEECTAAVTITKGTPANGSFTLDKVGEQSTCDGQLVVTVSDIVPVSGYRFQAITQTGIEGAVIDQDNKTVTYAKKANGESTINVVFEAIPTYIISFYDNGTKISEQEVLEGESAEKPEDPEPACSAYTFEGWYTAELVPNNTEKPTYVTDFTATQNQNYYAIFKKVETIEGESSIIQLDATKDTSFPKDGITLSVSSGVLNNGTDYRVYKGASLTITSSVGDMSNIALTYDGSYDGGGWASSYQPNAASWTSPNATSGNSGKQARITFIEITIGTGSVTTTFYTSSVLAINCSWPTDMEEIETTQPVAIKALMNGQIVIIRGEAVYSITGARIK